MSKLHNVRGRITYISSHAKQENLFAVYDTTDRHYWTELASFNQQEFTGQFHMEVSGAKLLTQVFHKPSAFESGVWERNTPFAQIFDLYSGYFALAGSKFTQA